MPHVAQRRACWHAAATNSRKIERRARLAIIGRGRLQAKPRRTSRPEELPAPARRSRRRPAASFASERSRETRRGPEGQKRRGLLLLRRAPTPQPGKWLRKVGTR